MEFFILLMWLLSVACRFSLSPSFIAIHLAGIVAYIEIFSEVFPSFLEVLDISLRPCPWSFKSIDHMLKFCSRIFGLQEYSYDELWLA